MYIPILVEIISSFYLVQDKMVVYLKMMPVAHLALGQLLNK
jgi:hypothetical protein